MSSPWPTLAAACWVARSRGRRGSPSGARPAAIAPEETSTVSPGRSAIASTSASTRVRSRLPVAVVRDDEPTLTTTRPAPRTSSRTPPIIVGRRGLRGGGPEPRREHPAREGDVLRCDRRLSRAGRAASGGHRHGPVRRGRTVAPGGHRERADPTRPREGGAAPSAGGGHAVAGGARGHGARRLVPGMSERFRAAYDALLRRWPVPVEAIDVPTAYGTTRVNACGPDGAPPLVLLHSGGATSTVWFGNVGALSQEHRVYAVDRLGDAGRGVADGRPMRTRDDLMAWLEAVLDGLGVDLVRLCGHSYGAWQALSYTLRHPERVSRLALLDPTDCFAGLGLRYRLRAVRLLVRPSPDRIAAFLRWETGGAALDPGRLAGRSRAHDVAAVEAGARRLLPDAAVETLPEATHSTIPTGHAAALNDR